MPGCQTRRAPNPGATLPGAGRKSAAPAFRSRDDPLSGTAVTRVARRAGQASLPDRTAVCRRCCWRDWLILDLAVSAGFGEDAEHAADAVDGERRVDIGVLRWCAVLGATHNEQR